MTTVSTFRNAVRPVTMLPAVQVAPSVGIVTLTRIELRKLTDTRASRWLLAITLVGTVATGAVWISVLNAMSDGAGWLDALFFVSTPVNALLPVAVILLITQEWSQRTALTTFVLEPRRGRVIAAKLLTMLVVTAFGAALTVVAAAASTWLGSALNGSRIDWAFDGPALASSVTNLLISMLIGAGFGLLLMSSPAAIALYFIVPTATAALAMLPGTAGRVGQWISGEPWGLLFTPMTATQWAQAGTAFALWAVLPLVLGIWRTLRVEAK